MGILPTAALTGTAAKVLLCVSKKLWGKLDHGTLSEDEGCPAQRDIQGLTCDLRAHELDVGREKACHLAIQPVALDRPVCLLRQDRPNFPILRFVCIQKSTGGLQLRPARVKILPANGRGIPLRKIEYLNDRGGSCRSETALLKHLYSCSDKRLGR